MRNVCEGYVAECVYCRRPIGEPLDLLPRARMTVNAKGDLVMRMIIADGCAVCGTGDAEIVVQRRRPTASAS
jgi:hypothetical protein